MHPQVEACAPRGDAPTLNASQVKAGPRGPGSGRWLVLPLLLALGGVIRGHTADTNAVLAAWFEAQQQVTNWAARFVQTRSLKALRQPLMATGQVWFARPNHFRWELGDPPQTIAVRGEGQLQVIYPRLKRVERYALEGAKSGPLGEALGLLDAGFPKDRADFDARFRLLSLARVGETWELELQPASASARRVMTAIRLTLAQTNLHLLANELVLPDGSRMRNEFREASLNGPLPPGLFQPALGPEYKVTQPLAP